MSATALPADETRRLAALASYDVIDTPADPEIDELARLAAAICDAPVALVSLVDGSRQWFKARVGLELHETPRSASFCAHAIAGNEMLIVADTHADPRFENNPLVTGPPGFRFYAGSQLLTSDGFRLGTLCVLDHRPRTLTGEQCSALRVLARQVMALIERPRDAARLERAEAELRRSESWIRSERQQVERLKSDFVATVSHELRTPLTSIRGSLGLLASGVMGELTDEARQVVTVAECNSVRLISLINDILDIQKLEHGQERLELRPVPLRRIIDASIAAVEVSVRYRIAADPRCALLTVLADETRLVQVLVSLVSNALKYSRPDATVRVAASERAGMVEVRVEDQGIGIPAEAQKTLFQRFHQLDSGDSRAKPGAGLGLAICRAVIDLHRGRMGVESKPGEGSAFWFSVPAASLEAAAHGRGDVLLIEDDAALVEVMAAQLAAEGLSVRTAGSAAEGLLALRERPPALLVLDVGLPDVDGYGVVEELRGSEMHRALPLIVYTCRDLTPDQCRRLELGPTRFLTKTRAGPDDFGRAVVELMAYDLDSRIE